MNEFILSPSAQLKASTKALHYQLDHQSAMRRLVASDITLGEYAALLQRMWRCYRAAEIAMDAFVLMHAMPASWADPGIYRRTPDLEHDLCALQSLLPQHNAAPVGAQIDVVSLPVLEISSIAHAAGCVYVLGGARMGAQVIARILRRHLGNAVLPALQFFEGGQPRDGQAFAQLLSALDSALHTPALTQQALQKAGDVFRIFLGEFAPEGQATQPVCAMAAPPGQ